MEAAQKQEVAIQGNQQELTNYLRSYEPIPQLTQEENKVLELKYQAPPLASLSKESLFDAVRVLLLKIHVIAGWPVPEKELKNILTDQLSKKIKESYPTVNAEEIEYAFRQNSTVKDWGKSINLILIDEVLREYLYKRLEVSNLEEKYKHLPPPVKDEDVLSDEDFLEANKSVYGLTKIYGLVSARCYDILIKSGKIKRAEGEDRERIIKIARSNFFAIENRDNIKDLSHGQQDRYIEQHCKKIMVCEYFNSQA